VGDDVARLQRFLADLGLYDGAVDGRYGAATARAVTLFNDSHGRHASGGRFVVGSVAWVGDAALVVAAGHRHRGRRADRWHPIPRRRLPGASRRSCRKDGWTSARGHSQIPSPVNPSRYSAGRAENPVSDASQSCRAGAARTPARCVRRDWVATRVSSTATLMTATRRCGMSAVVPSQAAWSPAASR